MISPPAVQPVEEASRHANAPASMANSEMMAVHGNLKLNPMNVTNKNAPMSPIAFWENVPFRAVVDHNLAQELVKMAISARLDAMLMRSSNQVNAIHIFVVSRSNKYYTMILHLKILILIFESDLVLYLLKFYIEMNRQLAKASQLS